MVVHFGAEYPITGLNQLKVIFDDIFSVNHSAFDDVVCQINPQESILWSLEKYWEAMSGVDGITVNTIHQAKGLEFDLVILNNVSEGRIPYQAWNRVARQREPLLPQEEADGKTLFYVGVSRAKAALVILNNWKPSIFLDYVRGK